MAGAVSASADVLLFTAFVRFVAHTTPHSPRSTFEGCPGKSERLSRPPTHTGNGDGRQAGPTPKEIGIFRISAPNKVFESKLPNFQTPRDFLDKMFATKGFFPTLNTFTRSSLGVVRDMARP